MKSLYQVCISGILDEKMKFLGFSPSILQNIYNSVKNGKGL